MDQMEEMAVTTTECLSHRPSNIIIKMTPVPVTEKMTINRDKEANVVIETEMVGAVVTIQETEKETNIRVTIAEVDKEMVGSPVTVEETGEVTEMSIEDD